MFEGIANFFKKLMKSEEKQTPSKETAKERLHLVLMQDRANVSADFLELMKQEIIEVIKKYIEVEESAIDVRLTKEVKEDGTQGAPSLYANIPILNIKNDMKNEIKKEQTESVKEEKSVGDAAHSDPIKDDKVDDKKEEIEKNSKQIAEDNTETKKEEKTEEVKEEENKDSKNIESEEKEDKETAKEEKKETEESETVEVEDESIKEEKTEENKKEEDDSKKEK